MAARTVIAKEEPCNAAAVVRLPSATVPGLLLNQGLPLLFTNLFALVRFAQLYPDSPHPSRSLQHTLIALIMFHFTKGSMPWLLLAVSRFGTSSV